MYVCIESKGQIIKLFIRKLRLKIDFIFFSFSDEQQPKQKPFFERKELFSFVTNSNLILIQETKIGIRFRTWIRIKDWIGKTTFYRLSRLVSTKF